MPVSLIVILAYPPGSLPPARRRKGHSSRSITTRTPPSAGADCLGCSLGRSRLSFDSNNLLTTPGTIFFFGYAFVRADGL